MAQESVRTVGDGIDNSLLRVSEVMGEQINFNLNMRPSKRILHSLRPVKPSGKIIELVPKFVPKEQKLQNFYKKPKEPKFVPYEPYKAAVEPIVHSKASNKIILEPSSKNNVEINYLVNQMSEMRAAEMKKSILVVDKENYISRDAWESQKESYENDIKNLRESNAHLENQLKFQAQVNSELKTLLVAAVGEDLETRVQHLTEDKLQLARALLNSANHLTSHQEQTEWLSGQCEVWRSKFLASSLMVEELAHWKSALTIRINELQNVIKSLIDERNHIHKQSLELNRILKNILKHINKSDPDESNLNKLNCMELSQANLKLIENTGDVLNVPKSTRKYVNQNCSLENTYTQAEKNAINLLQNPVKITNKQDKLCSAVLGAASVCGEQLYLQHSSIHVACCSHCKGEVKNGSICT